MRKVISFLLVIILLLGVSHYELQLRVNASESFTYLRDMEEGSYVRFGGQPWMLLDAENSLLIRIDSNLPSGLRREYDTNSTSYTLFNPNRTSNIAYYLNTTYYNTFSNADKQHMVNHTFYNGPSAYEERDVITCKVGLPTRSQALKAFTFNGFSSRLQVDWYGTNYYYYTMTKNSSNENQIRAFRYDESWYNLNTGVNLWRYHLSLPVIRLRHDMIVVAGAGTSIGNPFYLEAEPSIQTSPVLTITNNLKTQRYSANQDVIIKGYIKLNRTDEKTVTVSGTIGGVFASQTIEATSNNTPFSLVFSGVSSGIYDDILITSTVVGEGTTDVGVVRRIHKLVGVDNSAPGILTLPDFLNGNTWRNGIIRIFPMF
jgi:hypothetical protein